MIGTLFAETKCAPYRPCILLALSFASFSVGAWSQTQLATVFGTINDPSGAVIPGAQVTIVNQSTGLKRGALTDTTGQYRLAGLPTGSYALRTEKEGFQTQVREGLALTDGRPGKSTACSSQSCASNESISAWSSSNAESTRPTLDPYPFSAKMTDRGGRSVKFHNTATRVPSERVCPFRNQSFALRSCFEARMSGHHYDWRRRHWIENCSGSRRSER